MSEVKSSSSASSSASSSTTTSKKIIYLDGETLTPEDLVRIGYESCDIQVELSEQAWLRVRQAREIVDRILAKKDVVYGINTGFGNFSNVIIQESDLEQLQYNLIRSHAAGIGQYLSIEKSRMLLALRINVLAKGHSGIREITVKRLLCALNANCVSAVPAKGTVGASGDLAPLAHLALGMMGEGNMYDPTHQTYRPAQQVLKDHKLEPIDLQAKEGLALINGTQLITAIGAEAIVRAKRLIRQVDCVAALTLEALHCSVRPFHPAIHIARPHRGQNVVAGRMRCLLNFYSTPSELTLSHVNCGKVQDSYSIRCIAQVHGITNDTIDFVYNIIKTECNSATDNPMIFPNEPRYALKHQHQNDAQHTVDDGASEQVNSSVQVGSKRPHQDNHQQQQHEHQSKKHKSHPVEYGAIMSGGNFHGEYPAKALDYLTIAIHEISSISERRIERLVNPSLSNLPAFLVKKGGLNSGFMIAHCTAAALVSENKTLCHPASVDSLSTSAAQEDHVSMGGFAARKALKVVSHVEYVVAIELMAAVQALEFSRPLKTTEPLERVTSLVREVVRNWDVDRYMSPDIEACVELLRSEKIWQACQSHVDQIYHDLSLFDFSKLPQTSQPQS